MKDYSKKLDKQTDLLYFHETRALVLSHTLPNSAKFMRNRLKKRRRYIDTAQEVLR